VRYWKNEIPFSKTWRKISTTGGPDKSEEIKKIFESFVV
jgi:hypothetical protein